MVVWVGMVGIALTHKLRGYIAALATTTITTVTTTVTTAITTTTTAATTTTIAATNTFQVSAAKLPARVKKRRNP